MPIPVGLVTTLIPNKGILLEVKRCNLQKKKKNESPLKEPVSEWPQRPEGGATLKSGFHFLERLKVQLYKEMSLPLKRTS